MKHTSHIYSISLLFVLLAGISQSLCASNSAVTIKDKGNYFEVTQDYTQGVSHYEMGAQLYQQILLAVPEFEQILDSYLSELFPDRNTFMLMLSRINDIKPQIPIQYIDEIEGMGSQISCCDQSMPGDGKLSIDELYLMELIVDVARGTECSGISVYGPRSATGNPMTARILDWYSGSKNQLAHIQAVTTVINGRKTICMIGYLGLVGVLTGFNIDGVFAGILDAPSRAPYSSTNKRSYILDLRYALENYATIPEVASFLSDTPKEYTYNHLILLSDRKTSGVLENNFSGAGVNIHRALRKDTSTLNTGVSWGFSNAVGVVNSFLLSGNFDNHSNVASNTARWESLKDQLKRCGDNVSISELRKLISFNNYDGPQAQSSGDLYNQGTQQIVLFQPKNFQLEVAFRPKLNILPTDPIFETIRVDLNPSKIKKDQQLHSKSIHQKRNHILSLNGALDISFTLSEPSIVTLQIVDMLGREVRTEFLGPLSVGVHKQQYRIQGLPKGMYYFQVNERASIKTRN